MRKLYWTLLVLGIAFLVVKKTAVGSYVNYFWSSACAAAKNQIPTKIEIDRVRNEIASLDGDINGMIRPIAEHKAAITRLKKEVVTLQAKLDQQRETLLTLTKDLEGNPTKVVYEGVSYTADRLRHKLQKDFDSYKRLEANLGSQRKILEAKETSLQATQEQLGKVVSKKREYEERLAQLEANEETLQIARIGSSVQIDSSRATQIEEALRDIERRQDVQRAEIELRNNAVADDMIPVGRGKTPPVDPAAIREYLEKTEAASSK
jgi:chromosome segregation ATPase